MFEGSGKQDKRSGFSQRCNKKCVTRTNKIMLGA
jgi:hypothetical protein